MAVDDVYCNSSLLNDDNQSFKIGLKFGIGATCVLSAIGSLLIILTYILFKDIRTIPRQLLLNLSIADLLTAIANLIGMLINFDKHLNICKIPLDQQSIVLQDVCITQASVAQFATNSSILWTIAIAFYMLMRLAFKKDTLADKLIPLYYIISWGVPLIVTIWFALAGYLGYDPDTTPGWCSIKGTITHDNNTVSETVIYPVIIGYTGFVYLAFLLLPVMYTIIRCHVKILLNRVNGQLRLNLLSVSQSVDLKMIFIPIIFIIIRLWSLIVDGFVYYADDSLRYKFESSIIGGILVIAKGIGDSVQGFANAVLFIGFTKSVRVRILRGLQNTTRCCSKKTHQMLVSFNSSESNTETSSLISQSTAETGYSAVNDS